VLRHGIPAIAEASGDLTPAPPDTWPDDRFDVVWTLTATPTGWNFTTDTRVGITQRPAATLSA
jgi:hypothetical protein